MTQVKSEKATFHFLMETKAFENVEWVPEVGFCHILVIDKVT